MTNAIKYSSKGTKVEVGINYENDEYRIFVKDRGEGIPDEYKTSIFNRFERYAKEGVKGTGLGLAIAKRLTEIHNGRIWVENRIPGDYKQGSIFYVELPKKQKK